MLAFAVMTVWVRIVDRIVVVVHLATELISAAAAIVMLAALAAAPVLPHIYPLIGGAADGRAAKALIRRSYTVTAGMGLTIAAFYVLGAISVAGP